MAEAAAIVGAVAATVIPAKTVIWDPLQKTIAESNDMNEIHQGLDKAMAMLVAESEDHKDTVQRQRTTMRPSNVYRNWIKGVEDVSTEVEKLRSMYAKESKRSTLFSFKKRSDFTKKMKKAASVIFGLFKEELKDILVPKKAAPVVEMKCPRIDNIPTLRHPLEQTLNWLSDEKVRGIRIHGLVGSGKTTIMQNLNKHPKVAEMFNIVIWLTVSREGSNVNMDIHDLQQSIAQRLKLDIGVTTRVDPIASIIKEELKEFKYLLLLDDVKEDLDLDEIGIPTNNNNGSKIVITTRLQHVCSSIATKHINVAKLKEKEALNIFKSILDRPQFEENLNFRRKMRQIVNWCCCHPLMISVAAGVFRVRETEESWHDGLMNLTCWPAKGDDGMQEIYKKLNCCFDFLEVTQKECFFYSAMYPEDSDIQKDCLLDNWAAEELLSTSDDVNEIRVHGREVLRYLKMVSLLDENTSQQSVKMHKLIRRAALHNLTTKDQRSLVKYGEALQKPLDVGCWKEKKWISLVDSSMNALPDNPDCPMLSTLFLQKNPNLKVIPQAFFEHMCNLLVLDLCDARMTSLPSSLSKLVTLKVLYLQKCVDLAELPQRVEELEKLEVLDIRGSGISNMPPQVKSLCSLRRLLVSFTCSDSTSDMKGKAVEFCQVISGMSKLKELVIDVEEGYEITLYGAIVNVVKLTSLSLLQFCSLNKMMDLVKVTGGDWKIHFPNEDCFLSYIKKEESFEIKNCQIFIGCDISSDPIIVKFMPFYKFHGEVGNDTISQTLHKEAAIELVNHSSIEHLSTFLAERLNKICSCVIKDCNMMRTLVEDIKVGGCSILDNLEKLHMINLPLLKNIYKGPMIGLSSLKTLVLRNCPELESVCTYGVILQLPEIRHLELEGCSKMKGLFSGSANILSPILPKLKKLILVDMPQLQSIMVSGFFEWPSLERLKILRCPELKSLPLRRDIAVKLTSIETEQSWWEALEIGQEVKEYFGLYCNF